jgi:hypothetical protein
MAKYQVTIPVAGHVFMEVEANSPDEAIERAMFEGEFRSSDIEGWELLEAFNRGNICYCPQPWEATAEEIEE